MIRSRFKMILLCLLFFILEHIEGVLSSNSELLTVGGKYFGVMKGNINLTCSKIASNLLAFSLQHT